LNDTTGYPLLGQRKNISFSANISATVRNYSGFLEAPRNIKEFCENQNNCPNYCSANGYCLAG